MKKNYPPVTSRRSNPIILVLYIGSLLVIGTITLLLHMYIDRDRNKSPQQDNSTSGQSCPASISLIRENDSELSKALYLADVPAESKEYSLMKDQVNRTIRTWIQKGSIRFVSVYFRNLNDASWMSIDGDRTFMPGSLIKVPIMIYYLKQEQEHPGMLSHTLFFDKPTHVFPRQAYKGDSILPGRSYKISELLRYMIDESDNNATNLLSRNLDPQKFTRIFTDLDIPPDEINDLNYMISPREYSKFFRVLYNASYLDQRMSEYALELLAKCRFSDGITKNLPKNVVVARKFGERGVDNMMDFSESAIVYKDHTPYLLTIMTNGSELKDQTELVSEVSTQVFESLNKN